MLQPDLDFPSIGRVVFGFLFTVALGVGILFATRRVLPRLLRRDMPQGAVRILERTRLTNSLQAHLLQVGSTKVLIAEGRNAIGMTIVPENDRLQSSSNP